jgi:DNA helicase-2/ATP-dependent DNA helicase PcrA
MFRIFGPPGTGKTTTLLNMVDEQLQKGTNPNHIAFLAFTRKAANEAKERASKRFGLDPEKDLCFFRTLHSMALSLTEIRPEQVMSGIHYQELSKKIGISLGRAPSTDTELQDMQNGDHPIINTINLARLKKIDVRQLYNETYIDYDWNTVNYVHQCYKEYKLKKNVYDFTDMLQIFVETAERCCPTFQVTFLDEAQDLSPLQWDIAHALDKKSKFMFAAGDDDQAIYRWAGADVDHFITLDGSSETLSQSYRVPKSIHAIAEQIAARIKHRYPKKYQPKQENGTVNHIARIDDLDLSDGQWLVLAQAGYTLIPVGETLKSLGLLYNYKGHRSISARISAAVNGWEQLRKGRSITLEAARDVYSYMSTGTRVKRGFKKLSGLDSDALLDLNLLQEHYGLLIGDELIWHKALDRLPEEQRVYITALLRRGEKFNAEPRITVSTIHGSKGGEADNVILFTDLSPAADEAFRIGNDDVHRVFYVAVTRAKENLYIIEPEDNNRSYYI